MDLQKARIITKKFYNGESTLEEERLLKEFLKGTPFLPDDLEEIKAQFEFYEDSINFDLPIDNFMDNLEKLIDGQEEKKIISFRKILLHPITGIAASILIIMGLYFTVLNKKEFKFEDTYKDNPELAYLETQKVLMYVSSKLNNGTCSLSKLSNLNYPEKPLKNLNKINTGFEKLQILNSMNHSGQKINN